MLFNHTLRESYPPHEIDRIPGVWLYPSRVLASSSPGDVVQLHADLKAHWDWVLEHYQRAGLPHTNAVVWDDSFEVAGDFPDHELSVFLFSEGAHRARPNASWFEIVRSMNNKNEFIDLCQRLEVSAPETSCHDTARAVDPTRQRYPLILKRATSASGQGVFLCSDSTQLREVLERGVNDSCFQIQQDLSDREPVWMNLQYVSDGHRATRAVATAQLMKGFEHSGNIYPAVSEPWDAVDCLAQHIASQGMVGPFAFDVAVLDRGHGEAKVIECNPRWNGCTYFSNPAAKLGASSWIARNIDCGQHRSLEALPIGDLEYRPDRGGVILINWGPIVNGKVGALIIDDDPVSLSDELQRRCLG